MGFDTGGDVGEGGSVAGSFINSKDLAQGIDAAVERIGVFEGVDSALGLAETFLGFSEGNKAGRDVRLEVDRLLEGHGGLFVGAGFEINQANIMQGRGVIVEGLSDFETFDGFAKFLFLGVKNAEAVISGGVFLVEFEDRKEGFFGTERLMIAHGSLGGVPEFFHLDVIMLATGGFGGFGAENRVQKG